MPKGVFAGSFRRFTTMDTFGTYLRVTTFGESHGIAVGAVIDGCPAGLPIDGTAIAHDLRRRRDGDPVSTGLTTARQEADQVEWLSGLLPSNGNGATALPVTLGTPLAFIIRNNAAHSRDYDELQHRLRPGHGDYSWLAKHGVRDHRGGGRCSARITAAWVVAGTVAKQLLLRRGITIVAQAHFDTSRCASSDTVGGTVSCQCNGVPAGWGSPYNDSLKARLAQAMMCIPSAISFEMGSGREATQMLGSEYIDRWQEPQPHTDGNGWQLTTATNHCGGVQGGISNGMPICFAVGFHPVVTLPTPIPCADTERKTLHTLTVGGRHDRCQVPRAVPIVEAMAAITLADFALQNLS